MKKTTILVVAFLVAATSFVHLWSQESSGRKSLQPKRSDGEKTASSGDFGIATYSIMDVQVGGHSLPVRLEDSRRDTVYIEPAFFVANNGKSPPIRQAGNKLSVDFVLTNDQIKLEAVKQIKRFLETSSDSSLKQLRESDFSTAKLALLPLSAVSFKIKGLPIELTPPPQIYAGDGGLYRFGDTDRVTWVFLSERAASLAAIELEKGFAKIHISFDVPGQKKSFASTRFSIKNVASTASKNLINEGRKFSDADQFLTIDQVANSVRNAALKVSLESFRTNDYEFESGTSEFNGLVRDFVDKYVEDERVSYDRLKGLGTIFVGKKAFQADEITEEHSKVSEKISSRLQTTLDSLVESKDESEVITHLKSFDDSMEKLNIEASGSGYGVEGSGSLESTAKKIMETIDDKSDTNKEEKREKIAESMMSRYSKEFAEEKGWKGTKIKQPNFVVLRRVDESCLSTADIFTATGVIRGATGRLTSVRDASGRITQDRFTLLDRIARENRSRLDTVFSSLKFHGKGVVGCTTLLCSHIGANGNVHANSFIVQGPITTPGTAKSGKNSLILGSLGGASTLPWKKNILILGKEGRILKFGKDVTELPISTRFVGGDGLLKTTAKGMDDRIERLEDQIKKR